MQSEKDLLEDMINVLRAYEGKIELIANHGQVLDGYSALASFVGIAKEARELKRKTEPIYSRRKGDNKNPLFIEYYAHSNCDCFKICMPWTKFRKDTVVLCDVDKGLDHAKDLARQAFIEHLDASLAEPMSDE